MQQVKSLALGVLILVVSFLGAGPAFAISESSVVTATNTASVATVTVTAASNSVLVAMISGDGPSTASSQTTTVSGCGLSWVLVKRANARPGVADAWKTASSAALSNCVVTGRLVSGSFFVRLTVAVLSGAGTVGASTGASGTTGAAKAMLTSVQAGSLVYGVGSDWSVVQARTLLSGQRKLAESTPAGLGTFWAQALNGTSVVGSLTVGTSAPSSTNWNFSTVEILSTTAPPPCTFTVSPTTFTAPVAGTSSSVTVAASASTCAWTAASNAWLSVAPTGGTGSGSVTVTSAANSGASRSASVTVAGTSVTVNQDAAASGSPTLVATCPPPQSATSPDGQPVAVSYLAATTTGGVAPVTVLGSPASGSLFPVGTTMVTQTATSADGQSDACTNGVTVTAPSSGAFAITGVGTFTHGASVTITGAQFGTKPTAAPLKYDTFEAGANGSRIAGWNMEATGPIGDAGLPTYSSAQRRPNSAMSDRSNFVGGNWGSSLVVGPTNLSRVYLDFWYYLSSTYPYSRNHKLFRVLSNGTGQPNLYYNLYCANIGSHLSQDGISTGTFHYWPAPDVTDFAGKWTHLQFYLEQSSPNVDDGTAVMWVDGVKYVNLVHSFRTRTSSTTSWDTIHIGNFLDHGTDSYCPTPTGDAYTYFDDLYLDTTQARVELGEASTYANAKHHEIQLPQAWSDGSITIKANRGSFVSGQTVYLYVVTAAGAVSPGFAVTLP